jgi:hypothetical protein
MKSALLVFIVVCSINWLTAQQLGPQDTLCSTHRTFGLPDSLLEITSGFGATFFIGPQQTTFNPLGLLQPGLLNFSSLAQQRKKLTFSALPHLGFGYSFGAQGSQLLRLDFEQAFPKNTLFNIRYDRWQRAGFLRSDELQFSNLQLLLYQKGAKHEVQLNFQNSNDDRNWPGGLNNYAQIGLLALDLQPIQKEQSKTQQIQRSVQIDFNYRIFGDSLHKMSVVTSSAYDNKKRTYSEVGDLLNYYPQVFINSDTSADHFIEQFLENQLGLQWKTTRLEVASKLGLKQRKWSDPLFAYDTTELNLHHYLNWKSGPHSLRHQNRLNIIGAGQGWHFKTSYEYKAAKLKINLNHLYSNEWPLLFQRSYYSNLTNYYWQYPQKEKIQQFQALINYEIKAISFNLGLAMLSFDKLYRFDFSSMSWSSSTSYSKGKALTIQPQIAYQHKALQLRANYQFLTSENLSFLPKHMANLGMTWKGGIFKDQRLKLVLKADICYQSAFKSLVYLPFIESLDWLSTSNNTIQNGFFNANVGAAIEVKTFRFFVNASNLGSFWSPSELSVFEGYPFAPLQIRLGLTWDFWN